MSLNRSPHAVTAAIRRRSARLLKTFAAVAGASGVVVIALQCIWWFEDGFWRPKSLLDLWLWLGNSYSINASATSDRIGLELLGLPLAPVLLVVAIVLFWVGKRVDP
jgi:hypothetical protein